LAAAGLLDVRLNLTIEFYLSYALSRGYANCPKMEQSRRFLTLVSLFRKRFPYHAVEKETTGKAVPTSKKARQERGFPGEATEWTGELEKDGGKKEIRRFENHFAPFLPRLA